MPKIWIAEFDTRAVLKTAEIVKETDKTVSIDETTIEAILGWPSSLPRRLDKARYHIFRSGEAALDFLIAEAKIAVEDRKEWLASVEAEYRKLVEVRALIDKASA